MWYNSFVDARFDDLLNFYRRLDEVMPSSVGLRASPRTQSGNICGGCFECCRFNFTLTKHEFDCMEAFLLERHGRCQVRWVTCSTPLQDARRRRPVDPTYCCPLYADGQGCTVYKVRPLACRTFGWSRPHHTQLPDPCVFTETMVINRVGDIPLWDEYTEVIRRSGPSPVGYFVARADAGPVSE